MDKMSRDLGAFVRLLLVHRRPMVLGMLLGLAAILFAVGLLSLAGWFLTATAVAGATAAGAAAFNFFFPSIGVRLFAFGRTLARYGERVVSHDATFRILESLRVWFYRHLEPLSPACLNRYRSGDILNRLVEDIDALDNLYLRVLSPAVIAVLTSFLLFFFLLCFDPALALAGWLLLWAAGVSVSVYAGKLGGETGRQLAGQGALLRTRTVEHLQGLPELMLYGAGRRHLEGVREDSERMISLQRKMNRVNGFSTALLTLFSGLALLAALYIGLGDVSEGDFNAAVLAMAVLAVFASFEAVWPLPSAFQYLGRTREAGARLLEIVRTPPATVFPPSSAVQPVQHDLRFVDIRFRYPGSTRPALNAVHFSADAGVSTAVIGVSGSGKSTLVHLLSRFWDPDSGRIFIGGHNIAELGESALRSSISIVSQHAHLFNTTVRENLTIANPAATETDLRKALYDVQLLAFVESLPDGLETRVGEGGKRLSGGQARRLTTARALLHDAPIQVLDEPTEGLDAEASRNMLRVILGANRGKTVLLITHRLTDLDMVDEIVVLEAGRILATGDHPYLMRNCPRYAELSRQV